MGNWPCTHITDFYEVTTLKSLHQCYIGGYVHNSSLEYNIVNDSIMTEDTNMAIDCLKSGTWTDRIRVEFVKSFKLILSPAVKL